MHAHYPNRNILWASVLVDEAVRQGVRAAVIVPGSRSTPLVWAWARQNRVPVFAPWDERSAGYFALGLAVALQGPVAVVTTSGTAVANLYPALMEAERLAVPLLFLTADRPPEAYDSGANQTVDQIKAFGERVRWFAQVPLPEAQPTPYVMRSLRTLMARAVARSRGIGGIPGPVHLNIPFRKPLEPTPVPHDLPEELSEALARAVEGRDPTAPWTRWVSPSLHLPPEVARDLAALLQSAPRGLIVAGPYTGGEEEARLLVALARRLGYPLLADPLSGLRFGPWIQEGPVLGGYALALEAGWQPPEPPQVVLRFGAMPVGNGLLRALEAWDTALHILVEPYARWFAADHLPARLDALPPKPWAEAVLNALTKPPREETPWLATWKRMEARVARALAQAPLVEGAALPAVLRALPEGATLVVGNSLPVRHLEEWGLPMPKRMHVWANRGTSGIDGVLSTAMGLAAGGRHPLVVVLGDHSFLYDMNILALVRPLGLCPVVIVLHNNGGGIFYRLPIHAFDPPFTPYFRHPHGLDFRGVAETFRLAYRETPLEDLEDAVRMALAHGEPTLLVVPTDAAAHEAWRQSALAQLSAD